MAQSSGETPKRGTAVAVGSVMALAGVGIVALSIWGSSEGFHAPRWVVGSMGGAFLLFGAWTAVCYALGYDPNHPEERLPPSWVQLSICLPGLILFAAPFHWIAFGTGPREFSGGVSIPFLTIRNSANATAGRVLFGLGAIMIDVLMILWTIHVLRQERRKNPGAQPGPRLESGP